MGKFCLDTASILSTLPAVESACVDNTDDPCLPENYKELNDRTRSSEYENATSPLLGDHSLQPGWYRFVSPAGGDMPTEAPEPFHCQATNPIWLNGTLPVEADGIVKRGACARRYADECYREYTVCVKNCGDFNVYHLPTTDNSTDRYCFGSETRWPEGKNSWTGYTPNCGEQGSPVFKSHHPNYGPVSGNTVVVLTGNFTNITQVSFAALKLTPGDPGTGVQPKNQDPTWTMDLYSRNLTHILLKTKAVQEVYTGVVFLIHIEYVSNGVFTSRTTNFDFTYRPDPSITALYSKPAAFISGGIALTALGENLDSVANPVMLIHMQRRKNFGSEVYTFRSEDTCVYNDTALVGITPVINTSATNTFRTGLKHDGNIGSLTRRRRRKTATSDPENPSNSDTLEFFIGFELDGVTRFENLSEAIDAETGRLVVYQTPHIERYKETKKFNPNTETVLVIHVSIGYFEFKVGSVEYVLQGTTVVIIIGCVVGTVLLLAALVGISVLCYRNSVSVEIPSLTKINIETSV